MKFDNHTLILLRRSPLFRALEPSQFNALVDTARLYTLNEGELLFRQGDPLNEVFVNIKGFVKLFRLTPNGDEKVVDIIVPGSSFAEAVLFMGGRQYPVHAVALKPATVVGINAVQYEQMLRSSVDVCFGMMGLMSRRMHWLLNEVDRLTLHNATFRLVIWLLEARCSDPTCNRIALDVPKHVVASRLSIKPETFSRILKRLANHQLISVNDQHIDLLDVAMLEEMIRVEL
ncbi:Crp/Fnr family transcriptional regulator [Thiothrix fructosivorans]|uniref:Crp/Fnr family transcriptional regulator n=1 Tax=Thiothrix fructosivorans TaxID=111770 RepID=A0A8B0SL29_9GAMM|nr:Crp/Fnr family transcriptional regulator [Thiothrix fructosivorans]MBO0611470.1 Crp/Fnr family transcriptional regulator [Thiothrix fructosivorans]QTX12973.1 Crp/Fnr family transcriptional regulator [Thiothrix fructosivorans]